MGSEIPVKWAQCGVPSTELAPYVLTEKNGVEANTAILVLEGSPIIRGDRHSVLFDEAEYIINQASYDIYQRTGAVPKVNLVGYSRGGNIAVMYAARYPYNVDRLISIDTPHMGSNLGSLLYEHNIDIPQLEDMFDSPGAQDCMSTEVTDRLMSEWNKAYELNPDIHAYPIGTFIDITFVEKLLTTYFPLNNDVIDTLLVLVKKYPKLAIGLTNIIEKNLQYILTFIRNFGGIDEKTYDTALAAGEALVPYLKLNKANGRNRVVLMDDLFIDYYSQIGSNENRAGRDSYHGFQPVFRKMTGDDPSVNFDKRSLNNVPVGHNLAARDPLVIDAICRKLLTFNEEYAAVPINQNECVLTGAKAYAQIELPETIDGRKVVGIASQAFSGNKLLERISIPANVQWIGEAAFENCSRLTAVTFAANSQLKRIEDYTFRGCPLTSLELPAALVSIENSAIDSCGALVLTADANNPSFTAKNNVLYNKTQTELLCYPQSNQGQEFIVPQTVEVIAESAFYGNPYLQKINLSNTRRIGASAFENCSGLSEIIGAGVGEVCANAFAGTAWHSRGTDFLSLGNVLIEYLGDTETLTVDRWSAIAPMAFAGNTKLKTLYLDTGLIGDLAFLGCEKLDKIYLLNPNRITYAGFAVLDAEAIGSEIFVPYDLKDEYTANEFWAVYQNRIAVPETVMHLDSAGGTPCEDVRVAYGTAPGKLPTPTRTNYDFAGWRLGAEPIDGAEVWTGLEPSVTLSARWTPKVYVAALYLNGGTGASEVRFTAEAAAVLPVPTRTGYTFAGWFGNEELSGAAVTEIAAGSSGDRRYYAKWEAESYEVTLNPGNPGGVPTRATAIFGRPFAFGAPTRDGYTFGGWADAEDLLLTDGEGNSLRPWSVAQDSELHAVWALKRYYIKVTAVGTVVWLGSDGFSGDQSAIEYGTQFGSLSEIEAAFNPQKNNILAGHKFAYFSLKDQNGRFTFWNGVMPDVGPDGTVVELEARFEVERYAICYNGYVLTPGENPLEVTYGQPVSLKQAARTGYTFGGWKVAANSANRRFDGTPYAMGAQFDYDRVPDLTPGKEDDANILIYLDAVFEPMEVTVTFSANNGSSYPAVTGMAYDMISYSFPCPVWAGREFLGWYDDGGVRYADEFGSGVRIWDKLADTTLTGKWRLISYTIDYILDGGDNPTDALQTYNTESPTYQLPTPIKSGYRFMGWFSDPDFTGARQFSLVTGTIGHKIYYAQWAKEYSLLFQNQGAVVTSKILIDGETLLWPSLSRGGYKGQWSYAGSSYEFGATFVFKAPSANVSILYANVVWTEKMLSECRNPQTYEYEIWTYNQLNQLRTSAIRDRYGSWGIHGNYRLKASIDCQGKSWIPIPHTFKGIFYGNSYSIQNFKLEPNANGDWGFFECVSGRIEKLHFRNVTVTCAYQNPENSDVLAVGVIAGTNVGTLLKCSVNDSEMSVGSYYHTYVGGIVGWNGGGIIDTCYHFGGNITGWGDLGGIAGTNAGSGWIKNCDTNAKIVYDLHHSHSNIGGITGKNAQGSTVDHCSFNGFISWESPFRNRTWTPAMGYIVGRNEGRQYANTLGASAGYDIYYYHFGSFFDQSTFCFKIDGGRVGYKSGTASNTAAAVTTRAISATNARIKEIRVADLAVYEDATFSYRSA